MKNNTCSKKAAKQICEAVVWTIIITAVVVMIILLTTVSKWEFAHADIVCVVAIGVTSWGGYELIRAFVRWGDKKGIL